MAEYAPGMRTIIRDEEWMIKQFRNSSSRPTPPATLAGKRRSNVEKVFAGRKTYKGGACDGGERSFYLCGHNGYGARTA